MLESIEGLRECIREHYNMGSYAYDEIMSHVQATEREIAERYMPLPVDADGVPIRVGDMTNYGRVNSIRLRSDLGVPREWVVYVDGVDISILATDVKHVKPRTLTDILADLFDRKMSITDAEHEISELLGGDAS